MGDEGDAGIRGTGLDGWTVLHVVDARLASRKCPFTTTEPLAGTRRHFDDLTGTVLAGHHQSLRVWILCLHFMGLNLSNTQIARELGLNRDDAQQVQLI